jgi:hypothetical protein
MTLSVKGTQDLGLVDRSVGASPALATGANSVAMAIAANGEGVQNQKVPYLGGVAGTLAHYQDTPNQSSAAIYYWTPADVASMSGFALTFPGAGSLGSSYYGLVYFSVNDFGYDSSQDWSESCGTCGGGNDMYGNVGIPSACIDGQFLHVMAFDGYSGHSGLTGSPTQVFTYDGTHNAAHYKVNTTTLNQGYSCGGLNFYMTALGVVFYDADTDITVSPDPVVVQVTAPTHTEVGVYPDISEFDNQAQVEVIVPEPTIIVTHPQQIPLVGVHEKMPGRVPLSTVSNPTLTEVQDIPQWVDSSTMPAAAPTHASTTGQTTDDHHAKSHAHDGADGSGTIQTWEDIRPGWNGMTVQDVSQTISETGGTVYLNLDANPTGNITYMFGGNEVVLSAPVSIALTAGTDTSPTMNYVYITETGGVSTLAAGASWPAVEDYAPVGTVLVQSAASVALYGVMKHHAWTDHVQDSRGIGHIGHINAKLRGESATWISGAAGSPLVISSPDAYMTTSTGVVYQLHPHTMPALDMSTDGAHVINEPTTPNLRITSLDGLSQDASGGTINNRWFTLVLWGVISENDADCRLIINLPTGTYSNEALALADSDNYAVYAIPTDYTGVGFLMAAYVVQGKTSGTWVESVVRDLRGLKPAISPGTGTAVTSHAALSGITTDDHHVKYTDAEAVAATAASYEAAGAIATHAAITDAHHARYTDTEADARVAVHTGDATDAHDASAISVLDTAGNVDATDVEAAIAEIYTDMGLLGAGTPASTVTSETTYGIAAAVGVGTDYARNDHTHGSPADPDVAGAISTHASVADAHHAKYTDAEAVAAVEASASVDFTGNITMAASKNLTFASESNTIGSSTYGVENLYVDNILGVTGGNIDMNAVSVRIDGSTDVRFYGGASNSLLIWDGDQFYVTEASTGSKRLGHSSNYWDAAYIENIYVSGTVDGVDVSAHAADVDAHWAAMDTQTYDTDGSTFTKPTGPFRMARIVLVGAGGGGGSGSRGTSGSNRSGGASGGGGGVLDVIIPFDDLPSSATVTIGTGGAGGAVQTSNSSNGNGGSDGTDTTFVGTGLSLTAGGGDGGGAGLVSQIYSFSGGSGGTGTYAGTGGSPSRTSGNGMDGGTILVDVGGSIRGLFVGSGGAGAGGAGGGINTSNTARAGGAGYGGPAAVGGAGGSGAAGSAGAAPVYGHLGGGGGGGGGGRQTGASYAGAAGARGGGGGGGGASTNGYASGAGGAGGDGYWAVVCF